MTNPKFAKRSLIFSAIALVLSAAMLFGATFAWFTDGVTVERNKIVAGNLDVELLHQGASDADFAKVESDTELFLNIKGEQILWEPGATGTEVFKIENKGTVALKYEFTITGYAYNTFNGKSLMDALTFNAVDADDPDDTVKSAKLANNKFTGMVLPGKSAVVPVAIEWLPTDADNDFNLKDEANLGNGKYDTSDGQPLWIDMGISLVATQAPYEYDSEGNDYDADAFYSFAFATPATIDDVLATVAPGTTIGLVSGVYGDITMTQDNLTLLAISNAQVDSVNLNAKDGITIDGITFNAAGAKPVYRFTTGNKKVATDYVANITGDTDSPKAADNVTIKNCTFTNTTGIATVDTALYAPIAFEEQGAATERASNITVENCVFACNALNYIRLNYLSEGYVKVINNVFGSTTYGTAHHNINASGNAANWTIVGNSFNNWADGEYAFGTSKQGSNFVTLTFTDNSFTKAMASGDEIPVLSIKNSYTASNSKVVLNNNVANNGTAVIDSAIRSDYKYYMAAEKALFVPTNTTELKDAVSNATPGDTIALPEGDYTLPTLADKEGVTIVGAADGSTVIGGENAAEGFRGNFGKNTTIKNVTFSGSTNGVRYSYAKGGDTVFENCTFAGDSTYGFHIDQSNGATFTFNNCTFIGFNAFAGDLAKVTFNNCTFLSNGNYGHTNIWSVGEFNNCTWGDNTSVSPGSGGGDLYFDGVKESYHHEFIGSAESLFAFAKSVNEGNDSWKGQKVVLVADIDLENKTWTPIGQTGATEFKGIFDGQGYTISNLYVDSSEQTGASYSSGLFGWIESHGQGITIKNVKVDGATIVGHHNCGVIVGYATGDAKIENCHVSNASVSCTSANDDANGDKAGVIVGNLTGEVTTKMINCSATDCTVSAGRDAGQLAGAGMPSNVTGCTATNVTVTSNGTSTGANINNALVGRVLG